MIDLDVFQDGTIGVVFQDNYSSFQQSDMATPDDSPFIQYAREVSGPTLFGMGRPQAPVGGQATDASGDATWPNRTVAANLPTLDILSTRVSASNRTLTATIKLRDAKVADMTRDLATYNSFAQSNGPADRLQYILRLSTATDIYHLSMEALPNGTLRFFGGKLDANDQIQNLTLTAVVAAGYNTDPSFTVSGSISKKGEIQFRIPISVLGFGPGTQLYSVTAFSTVGPLEADQSQIDLMRTVDAAPATDFTL
jgi:hypothetical protein